MEKYTEAQAVCFADRRSSLAVLVDSTGDLSVGRQGTSCRTVVGVVVVVAVVVLMFIVVDNPLFLSYCH